MNLDELKRHKAVLIIYLKSKMEQEDWHGVADAAMDLREVEARINQIIDERIDRTEANSERFLRNETRS